MNEHIVPLLVFLRICSVFGNPPPPALKPAYPLRAQVQISPNGAGTNVTGTVQFVETAPGQITITGTITGLSSGLHGFHIHEKGTIDSGCAGAGGHYNPTGLDHGGPGDDVRHNGDLGNIGADDTGTATFTLTDDRVTLVGAESVIGRAVVVHSGEDDLGQGGAADSLTTGHAGSRVACGVIVEELACLLVDFPADYHHVELLVPNELALQVEDKLLGNLDTLYAAPNKIRRVEFNSADLEMGLVSAFIDFKDLEADNSSRTVLVLTEGFDMTPSLYQKMNEMVIAGIPVYFISIGTEMPTLPVPNNKFMGQLLHIATISPESVSPGGSIYEAIYNSTCRFENVRYPKCTAFDVGENGIKNGDIEYFLGKEPVGSADMTSLDIQVKLKCNEGFVARGINSVKCIRVSTFVAEWDGVVNDFLQGCVRPIACPLIGDEEDNELHIISDVTPTTDSQAQGPAIDRLMIEFRDVVNVNEQLVNAMTIPFTDQILHQDLEASYKHFLARKDKNIRRSVVVFTDGYGHWTSSVKRQAQFIKQLQLAGVTVQFIILNDPSIPIPTQLLPLGFEEFFVHRIRTLADDEGHNRAFYALMGSVCLPYDQSKPYVQKPRCDELPTLGEGVEYIMETVHNASGGWYRDWNNYVGDTHRVQCLSDDFIPKPTKDSRTDRLTCEQIDYMTAEWTPALEPIECVRKPAKYDMCQPLHYNEVNHVEILVNLDLGVELRKQGTDLFQMYAAGLPFHFEFNYENDFDAVDIVQTISAACDTLSVKEFQLRRRTLIVFTPTYDEDVDEAVDKCFYAGIEVLFVIFGDKDFQTPRSVPGKTRLDFDLPKTEFGSEKMLALNDFLDNNLCGEYEKDYRVPHCRPYLDEIMNGEVVYFDSDGNQFEGTPESINRNYEIRLQCNEGYQPIYPAGELPVLNAKCVLHSAVKADYSPVKLTTMCMRRPFRARSPVKLADSTIQDYYIF